jgi:RNA polymerase sigma-70 factor (ECF subfamily)
MWNKWAVSLHAGSVLMEIASSDAELAARAASGRDADSETELVRRMAPRVRLYGLRHLRDGHLAEELTQQVLVIMLEALRTGRVRDPEKLASFVLGTCRLTVLDMRRSIRRQESLRERYGSNLGGAMEPALPDLDYEDLSNCVQQLTERERAVVVMTFYDDRTSADVAGFLGVTETNARVIRHRAIHRLRTCLGASA